MKDVEVEDREDYAPQCLHKVEQMQMAARQAFSTV